MRDEVTEVMPYSPESDLVPYLTEASSEMSEPLLHTHLVNRASARRIACSPLCFLFPCHHSSILPIFPF